MLSKKQPELEDLENSEPTQEHIRNLVLKRTLGVTEQSFDQETMNHLKRIQEKSWNHDRGDSAL